MVTTTLRRRAAFAVAAVALLSIAGSVPASAAVPITTVGWWTRSPSPPEVPAGGISVAQAPDGDLSVAAVMISTGEGGATGVTLSLIESGGEAQQAASLQACTTTDAWNGASGDPVDVAPRPACPSEPVLLARDDAGTWTADLTPLVRGLTGDISIMIVPGPPPAEIPGIAEAGAFQIAFQPPTVEGTVTPAADSSSGSPTPSPSPSPTFAPTPAFSVEASPAFAPVGNPPAAVLPAAEADAVLSSQDAGGGQVSFPVAQVGAPGKKTSKMVVVGIVALSILIGAAAAGLRAASEKGLFERLIPSGGGSSLKLPD